MSEHKTNLCDGCTLWPCGTHAPIGVEGCIVTECANRKPTSGELIATLKAQHDELLAAAKAGLAVIEEDSPDEVACDLLRAAIANAEKTT